MVWKDCTQRLPLLQEQATTQFNEAEIKQAKYYDARRRGVSYATGDLVCKKNKVLSSAAQDVAAKLAPKFAGLYMVLDKVGDNTYKLIDSEGNIELLVHVERLKKYVSGENAESEDEET